MNQLFLHDRLIAWNTIRATFSSWHDRVIAALMPLGALAVVRAWCADRPWTIAAWAAVAAGMMIGLQAGRIVAARLAYQGFDGVLAADALRPRTRHRYIAGCHGLGLAVLSLVTLIARPSLLVVSVPAYCAGALVAELTSGLRLPTHIAGTLRPGWTIRAWSRRPIAGLSAAAVLVVSLLPARTLGPNAALAVVGIGTVLLALMLTSVDHFTVRFMVTAGHGVRRIVLHHTAGVVPFLAVAVAACGLVLGPVAAAVVAAAGVAMLLLMTLRILAYRLHEQRFADILVSILTGLLMLVAYSVPVALPVVALAMVWSLQRRGRARTWLLT